MAIEGAQITLPRLRAHGSRPRRLYSTVCVERSSLRVLLFCGGGGGAAKPVTCAPCFTAATSEKNLRNVLGGPPPPLLPILSPSAVVAQDACPTGASAEGSVVASPPPSPLYVAFGWVPKNRRKKEAAPSCFVACTANKAGASRSNQPPII